MIVWMISRGLACAASSLTVTGSWAVPLPSLEPGVCAGDLSGAFSSPESSLPRSWIVVVTLSTIPPPGVEACRERIFSVIVVW
jgi:hypothetical protein